MLNRLSGSSNSAISQEHIATPEDSGSKSAEHLPSDVKSSSQSLPYREGYSDPRLPKDAVRADYLPKNDNKILEGMRFSSEEMKRTLASNVDHLTANASEIGWDRSFSAATNISMKAMKCIGTDKPHGNSILSLSQTPITNEKRYHYQPFIHPAMSIGSYDSDNYEPVEGDLRITDNENSCIQSSLLKILEKEFPEEMQNLKDENADLQKKLRNGEFDLTRRSLEKISI